MTSELLGQAQDLISKKQKSAKGVGIVGDLALDRFIFGGVERISPEAPVPVLLVERQQEKLGCAANVAANLAELKSNWDFPLYVTGVIGEDVNGKALLGSLKALHSDLHADVLVDSSRPTTVKTRFLAGSRDHVGFQHQLLRVDEESKHNLSSELATRLVKHVESILPKISVLVIQDYAKGVLSLETFQAILALAKKHHVLTIVDPNRNTPAQAYVGAGLITPNVSEAEAFLGRSLSKGADHKIIEQACHELKEKMKLQMCMITRSAHGMTLLDEDNTIHHFPSIARAVYDVTGAGDTVVAVLAASLSVGATMSAACVLATAAAGVVVAKVGTATASHSEIAKELHRL